LEDGGAPARAIRTPRSVIWCPTKYCV
jgi:hypothetical protein